MFCKVGKHIGFDAAWMELADKTNEQSKKEEEVSKGRPILKMLRLHI
jgi:hypothetical protein